MKEEEEEGRGGEGAREKSARIKLVPRADRAVRGDLTNDAIVPL